MNSIFIIFLLMLPLHLRGEDSTKIRALIHIEQTSQGVRILSKKGTLIPTIPLNKEIKNKLSQFKSGTEAFIEGDIHYEFISGDAKHQLKPFFIISAIHPVSLEELGGSHLEFNPEPKRTKEFETKIYSPPSLAVTTEVASAITMTTALMLMSELTSGNAPDQSKNYRDALFLSTGTMATLLFIYDQIEGKTKP
jgi:hypothetical protein